MACWSTWGHKESHATEQLNWTEVTSLRQFLSSLEFFLPPTCPLTPSNMWGKIGKHLENSRIGTDFLLFHSVINWFTYWFIHNHPLNTHNSFDGWKEFALFHFPHSFFTKLNFILQQEKSYLKISMEKTNKKKSKVRPDEKIYHKKKNHKYILNVVSEIKLSSLDVFCYLYIFL